MNNPNVMRRWFDEEVGMTEFPPLVVNSSEQAQRDLADCQQQLAAAQQQIAELQTTILSLQEQLRIATGQ